MVILGHRELWHSTYPLPLPFEFFEKFDGGREDRTLNPMRAHGNPRIISPGHYRSCYPAVEKLARLRGVEPPVFGLADRCSVGYPRVPCEGASRLASPLSYRRAGSNPNTLQQSLAIAGKVMLR